METVLLSTLNPSDQFLKNADGCPICIVIDGKPAVKGGVLFVNGGNGEVDELPGETPVINCHVPDKAKFRLPGVKLSVTDERTGEEEFIAPTDPDFWASLAIAAEDGGNSPSELLTYLLDGRFYTTKTGFTRRVVKG